MYIDCSGGLKGEISGGADYKSQMFAQPTRYSFEVGAQPCRAQIVPEKIRQKHLHMLRCSLGMVVETTPCD